jgi:uncharacterized protein
MAATDVNVEQSMEEILQQVQREYLGRTNPAATAPPHSAEILNLNSAADGRRRPNDSDPAEKGAAVALAQLAAIYRDRRRASEFPMGGTARTLEDVVLEMRQPMVLSWLAQKLPQIVERLVTAELSRVIGEAVAT